MFDSDKILVTGGAGLVGSCVTGKHKPKSHEVDLMNFDEIDSYIRNNEIECIVHCAARVGGVKENSNKLGEFYYQNMQMNLNVFEACRINKVKKIVSILTTCIFPADATYPLTYDQLHDGEPHHSNYGYAYAKRMVEINSRAYRDQYDMDIVNIIPCNIYGPRDNYNIESGHVVPSLINKAYDSKINNTPLHVWGDGSPLREFLYSEDVGKIIDWVINNYSSNEPLMISPDEEISIKEVAEKLIKMYGISELVFESDMPMGQLKKPSDNSRLKSLLDFNFTPFDVGLEKSVLWFNQNYESARK
tara:strand:- start:15 stop:923 length:909 start_codon:yes stop_codon:yes gene_type:complete